MESVFGQTVPQAINYQAIARNASGSVLVNQTLSIRISLLEGASTGTLVYSETRVSTTNQFGLFSLRIGDGTIISGDFAAINWGTANH
jgi:hypothetical protein